MENQIETQPAHPLSLFHYTGIDSLLGIEKTGSLWSSSIFHLNDGKEVYFARDIFVKLIAKRISDESSDVNSFLQEFIDWLSNSITDALNLFVFSLSEERSLLSQWRSYTPHGKGISIEFDISTINLICDSNHVQLKKVIYECDERNKLLDTLLDNVIHIFNSSKTSIDVSSRPKNQKYHMWLEQFKGQILQYFAQIKHPAFKEEKEWRLISTYFPNHTVSNINYRAGSSMLIPYIDLKLERKYSTTIQPKPVYFKSINLGPSQHSNLSMNTLSQFCSNKDITSNISNTLIPYREWN